MQTLGAIAPLRDLWVKTGTVTRSMDVLGTRWHPQRPHGRKQLERRKLFQGPCGPLNGQGTGLVSEGQQVQAFKCGSPPRKAQSSRRVDESLRKPEHERLKAIRPVGSIGTRRYVVLVRGDKYSEVAEANR